uniref:Putative secreted protein n=1 Tax=Ixodes ricinus TaxID=34613 RepID=A0A6B0US07_IXORI
MFRKLKGCALSCYAVACGKVNACYIGEFFVDCFRCPATFSATRNDFRDYEGKASAAHADLESVAEVEKTVYEDSLLKHLLGSLVCCVIVQRCLFSYYSTSCHFKVFLESSKNKQKQPLFFFNMSWDCSLTL